MAHIRFKDRPLIAAAAVAGLIGITVALTAALVRSTDTERLFAGMDANGDGFISRQEAWADSRVEQRFSLGDRNMDDKLDRAEFYELLNRSRGRDRPA